MFPAKECGGTTRGHNLHVLFACYGDQLAGIKSSINLGTRVRDGCIPAGWTLRRVGIVWCTYLLETVFVAMPKAVLVIRLTSCIGARW